MTYEVRLTIEAELDILALQQFILMQSGADRAQAAVDEIYGTCQSLDNLPERGHVVTELARLNERRHRELHWRSWRIIYQIGDGVVWVEAVIDGRRSVADVLLARLAGSRGRS